MAQHRSFRRADAELAVTPSAISQAIRALEARIGAALFLRPTRSVGLTEAGERFLSRAKPAFEELIAASQAAHDLGLRPAGLRRLSAPLSVAPLLLQPLIASFCRAYPDVEVEIEASGKRLDLAAEGFDAWIRIGQLIDGDMIAVRLPPPFPFAVVGSPTYLCGRTQLECVEDSRGHSCLRLRSSTGSIAPWRFAALPSASVKPTVAGSIVAPPPVSPSARIRSNHSAPRFETVSTATALR